MLLCAYFIFCLSLGIDGGLQVPVQGFENLATGSMFNAIISSQTHDFGLSMAFQGTFMPGNNPAYSFTGYGVVFGLQKQNWRVSPVLDMGFEYCKSKLGRAVENGFALNYGLGMMIKFHYESLCIYPKFSFEGVSDLAGQGGFLVLKLGMLYGL